MTLRELLDEEASHLPGIEPSIDDDGATTWSRGGRPFAALTADGSALEFGLEPVVAAAAIRTPDTTPSARGAGWVRFSPTDLDEPAADRAVAWFASAHRRAGPRD